MVVSPGTPVSSINKTDCHDMTGKLLKMALNTIHLRQYIFMNIFQTFIKDCVLYKAVCHQYSRNVTLPEHTGSSPIFSWIVIAQSLDCRLVFLNHCLSFFLILLSVFLWFREYFLIFLPIIFGFFSNFFCVNIVTPALK